MGWLDGMTEEEIQALHRERWDSIKKWDREQNQEVQRRRLIKAIARKGKCPQWYEIWQLFEDIAEHDQSASVRSAAAIGMSMLTVWNGPGSSILGNTPPEIWNEAD